MNQWPHSAPRYWWKCRIHHLPVSMGWNLQPPHTHRANFPQAGTPGHLLKGDWGAQSTTHKFPKRREGKQKEILFFFWGTDCYHITKASSWKDSSQEAPRFENRLDCLSFPGRLTPNGIRMEMNSPDCWAHSHYQMLECFTYLLLCGFLLPFPRTRAGAAAFSCGVRWTLPWKPRKQKTPPTRAARRWVAEVVFYCFFEHPSSRTLNLESVKHH